jgi:hypothetical protein
MRKTPDPAAGEIGSADDPAAVEETALQLLAYCRANNWVGYDPYDALNSRVFRALPFLNFKLFRLLLTQGVKRSPINLRKPLGVARTPNPKGIALFLASVVKLTKNGVIEDDGLIGTLTDRLLALRTPGWAFSCWGYNFDWQTRGELVPRGFPNIICSSFAAHALLDAYDRSPDDSLLDAAVSAAEFILDKLFWREGPDKACFKYTPLERSEVHNANLLGAALLCRIARTSNRMGFLEPALEATRYSSGRQHDDGSWDYGELPSQRWIDNFHTGYNLSALRRIGVYSGTREFEEPVRRGFRFYREHFFRDDGAPRYFHNATYPIDIHSVAQSIITLVELKDLSSGNVDLARSVLMWAMANMWDSRHYFYFQKKPFVTVRTPMMRWSEAWMLWALATLGEVRPDRRHD